MSEKENKSSQNTALAVQSSSQNQLQYANQRFTALSLDEIERLSIHFKASALFGLSLADQSKLIVKMLAGNELRIGPWTAVKEIYINSQNKLGFSAGLMATLLVNSGKYDYEIIEDSDEVCSIDFYKYGKKRGNAKFTIKQAERAGLLKKDTYKSYPEDMLFNRAMARGIRRFAPEVLCGNLYTPEELDEITEKQNNHKPIENQNNTNVIDVVSEEIKEDSTKKESFIASINKMNQVLLELGEPHIEENLNQLNLSQLKSTVDKKSYKMKVLLISKLVEGLPHDQELVDSLTTKSVIELYKMYQNLPKVKTGDTEQIIDAQVESVK